MAQAVKTVHSVTVRELVEFARRTGDLGSSRDFAGAQRALAGTRGHQRLQHSRPTGYKKEIRLSREVDAAEFVLKVQGRVDGVLEAGGKVVLEEIKTVDRFWGKTADPLHWAQARVYGFIYAADNALSKLGIQLTYLDLDTNETTEFSQEFSLEELSAYFDETVGIYLEWLRARSEWCRLRDESIRKVQFPFPKYRPGQRKLAVAAYRTLAQGGRLFLEAPTGIGKTISVIFPAVKALGEGQLERIFYLTARTVGRVIAEKAFSDLRQAGLRFRVVTLTAKEKICAREGVPCDPAACPLARGYYDRNKAAMRDALAREEIARPVLEEIGRQHNVCPFELSLDVSSWVDAIICDYNYAFDPKVYLRRHFDDAPADYAFLVDEAHNLVDRAREMFSADLEAREVREARRAIKERLPRCARALGKVATAIRKLCGESGGDSQPEEALPSGAEPDLFSGGAQMRGSLTPQAYGNGFEEPGRAQQHLPEDLISLTEKALRDAEAWLARNEPAEFREQLLEAYFRLHSFLRTADLYDERYATLLAPKKRAAIRLFCLDPSFLLGQALERAKASVFFSATLTPLEYYRDLLGGTERDPVLQLPSPFPPENLSVVVQHRVRTHYRDRAGSLSDVVEAILTFTQGRVGNYLVYLPSYAYLNAVCESFQARAGGVKSLVQRPGMAEPERESFLREFSVPHSQTLVGFAVMGGIFGEGIDLVGDRLIGVAIVGVGLPQLCPERDLIRNYFQQKTGNGFEFAYTYPGMNRVLQASGRVIRTELDRGVVLLIDSRFAEQRYGRLFPKWWHPSRAGNVQTLQETVNRFWSPTAQPDQEE